MDLNSNHYLYSLHFSLSHLVGWTMDMKRTPEESLTKELGYVKECCCLVSVSAHNTRETKKRSPVSRELLLNITVFPIREGYCNDQKLLFL